MEIITLNENQLIDCSQLAQITIGEYVDLWANKSEIVVLASGETCLSIEAHEVGTEFYHENEFEQYSIVYDHCCEKFEFIHNCLYGYIDKHDQGYFNTQAQYVSFDDELYLDANVAELFDIYYCGQCDNSYHVDEGCNCDKYCFSYHDRDREDWSNDSEYKIGLEIEKEDIYYKEQDSARWLLEDTGWIKEADSSLDQESGFELVSPILPLDVETPISSQKMIVSPAMRIEDYLSAEHSSKCGVHINISKKGLSSMQLLVSISGYLPLFYAMYEHRLSGAYSEARSLKEYIKYRDKNCAFYCKDDGILEIRIFPAVNGYNKLMWRMELLRIMLSDQTDNHRWVLAQIVNSKNLLHKHLRLIFDTRQLLDKVKQFCDYLQKYDSVQISAKQQRKMLSKLLRLI